MNNIDEVRKREKEAILFLLRKIKPYFEDPDVTNIWVDDGIVSFKKFGQEIQSTDTYLTAQECMTIIDDIASHMNIVINPHEYPVLEGTIPSWNARITGIYKWVKFPFITIRKRPTKVFSIDTYIERGQLTKDKADLIKKYIKDKKNILVSGGTDSGKTTFTNAIIHEMALNTPNERFYIVEDNPEIQCTAKYTQFLTIDTEDAFKCVKLALRASPNRIIFGEIRDGRVLWALLDSWNTGHPGGVSTIHASSAEGTFLRMKTLLKQAFGIEQPVKDLIDMIVHLQKTPQGIEIDEVIVTDDYTDSQIEEIAKLSIEADNNSSFF